MLTISTGTLCAPEHTWGLSTVWNRRRPHSWRMPSCPAAVHHVSNVRENSSCRPHELASCPLAVQGLQARICTRARSTCCAAARTILTASGAHCLLFRYAWFRDFLLACILYHLSARHGSDSLQALSCPALNQPAVSEVPLTRLDSVKMLVCHSCPARSLEGAGFSVLPNTRIAVQNKRGFRLCSKSHRCFDRFLPTLTSQL